MFCMFLWLVGSDQMMPSCALELGFQLDVNCYSTQDHTVNAQLTD